MGKQEAREQGAEEAFLFGIEALDKYYPHALVPGTSMLIAGHPGAGKTTFASILCYANALKGKPCLFVSFGEHKEKFIRHMRNFNMDFVSLEKKGLFRYARFPLITSRSALDSFVSDLMSLVRKHNASVIVIDGITPMIQVFEEPKARSFLQSVLYEIPTLVNGLLVLIADLPFGEEKIGFGGIDFVVDIVIIMKHRIAHGLLVRTMELRKFRGAPITIAEIPFRIIPGKGIRVFIPPTLEEVSTIMQSMRLSYYRVGVREVDDVLGDISSNAVVLFEKPPTIRYDELAYALFTYFIVRNNLKTLVVSYASTVQTFNELFRRAFSDYGLSPEQLRRLYTRRCRLIKHSFLNPARHSLEEIYTIELELINTYRPDVVVYMDSDVLASLHSDRGQIASSLIYNQLLYNKLNNVITVWVMTSESPFIARIKEELADYLVKTVCETSLCEKRSLYLRGLQGRGLRLPEEILKEYMRRALHDLLR